MNKLLTLTFAELPLIPRQIAQFRQAVNDLTFWQHDFLHNHTPEGGEFHRHALVLYRAIEGKATLVAINEAVPLVLSLVALLQAEFGAVQISLSDVSIQLTPTPRLYSLNQYLPFNNDNYHDYKAIRSDAMRTVFLEKVLTGHLLGLCQLFDYEVTEQLLPVILHKDEKGYHHFPTAKSGKVKHLAFDLKFEINLDIPPYLSLGKAGAKGFGIVKPLEHRLRHRHAFTQQSSQTTEVR